MPELAIETRHYVRKAALLTLSLVVSGTRGFPTHRQGPYHPCAFIGRFGTLGRSSRRERGHSLAAFVLDSPISANKLLSSA